MAWTPASIASNLDDVQHRAAGGERTRQHAARGVVHKPLEQADRASRRSGRGRDAGAAAAAAGERQRHRVRGLMRRRRAARPRTWTTTSTSRPTTSRRWASRWSRVGRSTRPTSPAAPVIMVNQTMAPSCTIPARARSGTVSARAARRTWFTVIGVLKDVKQGGVDQKTGTEMYFRYPQSCRSIWSRAADDEHRAAHDHVAVARWRGAFARR